MMIIHSNLMGWRRPSFMQQIFEDDMSRRWSSVIFFPKPQHRVNFLKGKFYYFNKRHFGTIYQAFSPRFNGSEIVKI